MRLWKIQKFLGDVVYDLRSRGLLAIVVLLLVAMVAVPFLIGSTGGSKDSPSASDVVLEQAAKLAPENQKAVVTYEPGLRNYNERLKDLTAKDPFEQQFAQAAAAASQLESTLSTSGDAAASPNSGGTVDTGTGDASTKVTTDTGGSTDTGSGDTSSEPKIVFFYYTTDLEAGEAAWTLQRRNGVKPMTPLPNETVPVAVYLGATLDGKRALFLVSNEVTQVSGVGECIPTPQDCSMLALRRGQTEDLLYGLDGKNYRIKVIRNRRIVSTKPPQG